MTPALWDAAAVRAALTPHAAVEALRARLLTDPPALDRLLRSRVPVGDGELMLMPEAGSGAVGVKLLGLHPGNPARGLPAVQGVYVLLDAGTLTPLVVMDAEQLTLLRTAAVSMLGVLALRPAEHPRVAVIGAGPQAVAHAEAAAALLAPSHLGVLARTPEGAARVPAEPVGREALASADVVLCATSSAVPVLDDAELGPAPVVVALGAYTAATRELPTALMARAGAVVVESRAAAAAEAGDVVIAEAELGRPVVTGDLAELVAGALDVDPARPRVLVTVGEAWEDLAVATAAWRSAAG